MAFSLGLVGWGFFALGASLADGVGDFLLVSRNLASQIEAPDVVVQDHL